MSLDLLQHVPAMRRVSGYYGNADFSTSMQVDVADFSYGDVEPALDLGHDRSHNGPFRLQRPDMLGQQDVNRQRPRKHPAPTVQA